MMMSVYDVKSCNWLFPVFSYSWIIRRRRD